MSSEAPLDPRSISASRMNALAQCGVAFEMKYVQKVPEQISGSAALFGSVVHEALEKWALNREQDLVTLMAQAWMTVTEGTPVARFIGQYQSLSIDAMRMEKKIRDDWKAKGRESKAPRMTADWKKSKVAGDINKLLGSWLPRLRDESPWRFTERDPLPNLYDESLILAKKYQTKWGHLPTALYVEFGFDVEWNGYRLHGYIDVIEPFLSPEGELERILVTDYKTYAKEPAPYKDWRQTVMYQLAVETMRGDGRLALPDVPITVCMDYVRLQERAYFDIQPEDVERFLAELDMYRKAVENEVFLPAEKGRNPDFCPYPEACCLTHRPAVPVELHQEAA